MDGSFFYRFDESYDDSVYDDKLIEMIRRQLEILLDVVTLTQNGNEIMIDGFKLRCDKEQNYRIDHEK